MSYRIISMRDRHNGISEADEFFEAAEMARKSVEKMHELASEMEDRYGERYYSGRGSYGMRNQEYGMRSDYGRRGGYGEREMYGRHYDEWEDDMYGDRRRRDSRGRFM